VAIRRELWILSLFGAEVSRESGGIARGLALLLAERVSAA
jgi:hypothetical protein